MSDANAIVDPKTRKFDESPGRARDPETVAGAFGLDDDKGPQAGDVMNADDAPEMDYAEHHRTYAGFVWGLKWATIIVAGILALLALFLVRGH